jgi:hypothetical protein
MDSDLTDVDSDKTPENSVEPDSSCVALRTAHLKADAPAYSAKVGNTFKVVVPAYSAKVGKRLLQRLKSDQLKNGLFTADAPAYSAKVGKTFVSTC